MAQSTSSTAVAASTILFVVGIDVGSDTCGVSILRRDKTTVRSPFSIANTVAGFDRLVAELTQLRCPPAQMRIGLEATAPLLGESLPVLAFLRL